MDWMQFAILLLSFVGLFTWNRSESRADIRHMDSTIRQEISVIREEISAIRQESSATIEAIRLDMKDFHARLAVQDMEFKMRMCAIEEKRKR